MTLRTLLQRIMSPAVSEPVSHVHVRYVAAVRSENAAHKLRQVAVISQLKRYVEQTTPEDRALEAETAFTVLASVRRASVRKGK